MKALLTIALLIGATAASAQTPAPITGRWAPWVGCWQISDESIADVERLLSSLPGPSNEATGRRDARVCVTPSADDGATMTTLVNGIPVLTETLIADGSPRPLTDQNCRGTQRAEWSELGSRIYARTEISCGDQPTRVVSGFSAVLSGPLWVDIQLIESGTRKSMRVRRYRPAPDQAAAVASTERALGTVPLGGKLTLAEIREASTKLPPEAVQAIVLELGSGGYDLNADRLIELHDAGVHDSVIDLMVAMSYPQKFVVERATPATGSGAFGGYGSGYGYGYGFGGLGSSPYGWGYYAHPMYYSAYYSPFGYYNWGYHDPYYYGTPGVVIINPGGDDDPQPTGAGRVVDGRGYTRIRPNVPDPATRVGSGATAGGTSAGSSTESSGGSNSGGSVSTGGYSGGGSSGSGGGRVAVPRPPGGH